MDLPGGSFAEYSYDALGRRIAKNVNGVIIWYVYDNEDLLLEYISQPSSLNPQLSARYTHGPGVDEPLVMERGGQSYYYHTDGLGSITSITDSSQNIINSYTYDSFGTIIESTGSLINPYTYTAREYDPETGLYYYRARYYDAKIGRFLQEDPIGDINPYPYCDNNPISSVDPYGLMSSITLPVGMPGTGIITVDVAGDSVPVDTISLPLPIPGDSAPVTRTKKQTSGKSQKAKGATLTGETANFSKEVKEKAEKGQKEKGSEEVKWRKRVGPEGERSRIRKVKDPKGETKEVWHEVFDKNGELIHRDWKGPGLQPY